MAQAPSFVQAEGASSCCRGHRFPLQALGSPYRGPFKLSNCRSQPGFELHRSAGRGASKNKGLGRTQPRIAIPQKARQGLSSGLGHWGSRASRCPTFKILLQYLYTDQYHELEDCEGDDPDDLFWYNVTRVRDLLAAGLPQGPVDWALERGEFPIWTVGIVLVLFNQRKFLWVKRGCQASQKKGLTSGEVRGTSREVWWTPGKSGKLPGNLCTDAEFHSERTSREVAGNLPGKFGEPPGKSRDFPEARGSLTRFQRLAKFVSNSGGFYQFWETDWVRFRRSWFQTPSSVNYLVLTEFWRENSVSSSQPIICVPKRTHWVFLQNAPSLPQNSVSSLFQNSALETSFRTFPQTSGALPIFQGLSWFVLFLFLGLWRGPTRNIPERVRDRIWNCPQDTGPPPHPCLGFWENVGRVRDLLRAGLPCHMPFIPSRSGASQIWVHQNRANLCGCGSAFCSSPENRAIAWGPTPKFRKQEKGVLAKEVFTKSSVTPKETRWVHQIVHLGPKWLRRLLWSRQASDDNDNNIKRQWS